MSIRPLIASLFLLALPAAGWGEATLPTAPISPIGQQSQFRSLAVTFKGQVLPERIDAWQQGYQVMLPLGALSDLLGLAITVQPQSGRAVGVAKDGQPRFMLDLAESRATVGGHELSFEPRLAVVVGGDIYVSTQLLMRWLPVELAVDLPGWRLRVTPRPRTLQAQAQQAIPPPTLTAAADPTLPILPPSLAAAPAAEAATPRPAARSTREAEANLLVMELVLDGQVLSDSFSAYQDGPQILLPLGEMARLLTLAIAVHADQGSAAGSVLSEIRPFALNLDESKVTLSGRELSFEPRLAQVIGDDIYVSSQLLSHWLPLDLKVSLQALQVKVLPREKLPLQARLERERLAAALSGLPANERVAYPLQASPIGLASVPFIDQSFGADARFGRDAPQNHTAYTAFMTGDLLGMEGSAYLLETSAKSTPDLRLTLSRHDPDGGLLGPLQARTVSLGSLVMPSVRNVMQGSPQGAGLLVSNRPLDQPTSFDRTSLRGDLQPGWDVTLYYNDTLLAYQAARADGQYAFDDLPLSFGPNEFRLVFHGPLGQLRVERQSFLLDQAQIKPGQFYYSVAQHYADSDGSVRSVAQADFGITSRLTGNLGLVRRPDAITGRPLSFGQAGLLGYLDQMILSGQLTGMQGGGALGELGLKTRLYGFTVDLLHTQRKGLFTNDQFSDVSGNVSRRDEARVSGTLKTGVMPPVTVAAMAVHNVVEDSPDNNQLAVRASTMLHGTALSNSLRWQRTGSFSMTDGSLQLSRRVADVGLNAQLSYTLAPVARTQALALTADHSLAGGYQLNAGVLRSMDAALTLVSAGVSRNFGSFGLALSASYSSDRETAVGLQLFAALDRDPRTGRWSLDGLPLAGSGAVSARAFVDRNMNGRHDEGEEWVPNAGFILNGGGRHPNLTDADGVAFLSRLQPGRYADVALDTTTLEDPQWKPATPGIRVLPRPGRVEMLEFPVVSTSEIEGTVWLAEASRKRRGIGDVQLELVDAQGQVLATGISSADGYYLLHQVMPGRYRLRIAPEQALKLGLSGLLERAVEAPPDGEFLSGQDLEVRLGAR